MKILIVSDAWHPQVNGVVRTYEHIGEELEKRGHSVHVIGPADFPVCVPLPGYQEIKLAIAPYRRLKKMIDTLKPDTIHIATEGPLGWAARRYCLRHGKPFTTSFHTHFPDYTARRVARPGTWLYKKVHHGGRWFVRMFHAPATAVMVATQSLEDELKEWDFKTPMHRVTRGAKLDLFYPGEKTLFAELKKPVALYVGRLAIEKSIDDFLEMPWNGSKVIVGDGPSMERLKAAHPDAHFVGRKFGEDLVAHYRSADIFVFPSRTDTFGMVLVEALACGLPVAGYEVTGPRDIVTESFLGALHKSDLAQAARAALESGSPDQRAQYVRIYYTWENAAQQFEEGLRKTF